jgi:hypothetical protein
MCFVDSVMECIFACMYHGSEYLYVLCGTSVFSAVRPWRWGLVGSLPSWMPVALLACICTEGATCTIVTHERALRYVWSVVLSVAVLGRMNTIPCDRSARVRFCSRVHFGNRAFHFSSLALHFHPVRNYSYHSSTQFYSFETITKLFSPCVYKQTENNGTKINCVRERHINRQASQLPTLLQLGDLNIHVLYAVVLHTTYGGSKQIPRQRCRIGLSLVEEGRVLVYKGTDNSEFLVFWKHAPMKVSVTNQKAINVLNCVAWKVWSWSWLIECRLYNINKQNAPDLYYTIMLRYTVQKHKKIECRQ